MKMADVMAEFYDGPHATPPPADDGPVYLGIKNLTDSGALDLSEVRHIAEEDFGRWTKRVTPQPDDIVFTYEATLHRYALIPDGFRGCLGRRLALIRPDRSVVNPRYLHLAMLGPEWRATVSERIISGSTVDRVPIITFPDFPIALPPLPIQERVAEILGAIGDLIENNRRRVEVLEEMARAIYREWFVRFRYPGHEAVPLVDSPLGPMPDGWQVAVSGELQKQGVLEIGDGYRAKNAEMSPDGLGLPFVRVANVRDGYLSLDGADALPSEYADRLRSKVSVPGDVVISMKGTVGRQALVQDWDPRLAYSPQVSFWRSLDTAAISSAYLYEWIRSEDFVQQCAAVKGATDMADYVNLTDQRRMRLLVPSESVMAAFTARVAPVLRLVGYLRAQAVSLASLRDLLLPKLVTGQIDVSRVDLDALTEVATA
jgi:type I restriction enzyme S subunit